MTKPPLTAWSAVKALVLMATLSAPYPVAGLVNAGATDTVASYTLVKPVSPDRVTSNLEMLAVAEG